MKNIIKKTFTSLRPKENLKLALNPFLKVVNELPYRDAILISSQNIKWTVSELDSYTNAFAKSLLEVGCQPGEKFLIWSDINHSAEIVCATIGAMKAGLTIVHSEFENTDEILSILKNTSDIGAFMFSPYNQINNKNRIDLLSANNELKLPRHVIQVSHKTIPGMIKFKQSFNYSNGFNSNIYLPELKENSKALEIVRPGKQSISYTQTELFERISDFNSKLSYSTVVNSVPAFYPVSLSIGLLANLAKKNYVVMPGSYSLKEILNTIKKQEAKQFICEGNLLDLQTNEKELEEIKNKTKTVESLIVVGEESEIKSKNSKFLEKCFQNAKLEFVDEFLLKRI